MTGEIDTWLRGYFSANARDVTPEAASPAVRMLYMPTSTASPLRERGESILSDNEVKRANRFITKDLKSRFIQRRVFRRFCAVEARDVDRELSTIRFDKTEKGRPFLGDCPDVWFSFSSCRSGLLGAWSTTHAVGVDVESRERRMDASELANRFFAQAEAQFVEGAPEPTRSQAFLEFWCLKEAALKSVGEGLPFGLDTFQFSLHPQLRATDAPAEFGGAERIKPYLVELPDCQGALVVRHRA